MSCSDVTKLSHSSQGFTAPCPQQLWITDGIFTQVRAVHVSHEPVLALFYSLFLCVIVMDFFSPHKSHFIPGALKLDDIYTF